MLVSNVKHDFCFLHKYYVLYSSYNHQIHKINFNIIHGCNTVLRRRKQTRWVEITCCFVLLFNYHLRSVLSVLILQYRKPNVLFGQK